MDKYGLSDNYWKLDDYWGVRTQSGTWWRELFDELCQLNQTIQKVIASLDKPSGVTTDNEALESAFTDLAQLIVSGYWQHWGPQPIDEIFEIPLSPDCCDYDKERGGYRDTCIIREFEDESDGCTAKSIDPLGP